MTLLPQSNQPQSGQNAVHERCRQDGQVAVPVGTPVALEIHTSKPGAAISRLIVVAISDAFREFWNDLAQDLEVTLDIVGPAEAITPRPETVAVILAAGGEERAAIEWLASHRVPPGLPALVVGTDPGR